MAAPYQSGGLLTATANHPSSTTQPSRRFHRQHFVTNLSQCLYDFVIQLLPTAEEMAVKEDVRKLLERLIRTIEPESRLLSFGSSANGFSLRNSDMDLCCLIDSTEPPLSAADLVTMVGDLLERETKFQVKTLPHARIPIVKLTLNPSPGLPYGIACDIGFENRLAIENTRLLLCYASIDPTRVRTLVLFLKVWSKRRKINSPYLGTLSSYGYVLLVIYFLVHVKNPPVLPNLQQIPPMRPISHDDMHLGGRNIWFFDDIELLQQKWQSSNTESVAELLIDFFKYYSRDFSYNTGVASIRAGLLKKDAKGWQNELDGGRFGDTSRDRNRLCIEDPFETDFNVARCVTKDGLYTIRGEFMRASRILSSRPERAVIALQQLCEERDEELVRASPSSHAGATPPRMAPAPAQTPYTIGANLRPSGTSPVDRLSPPRRFFEPDYVANSTPKEGVSQRPPLEHMAPRRGQWTSPPPDTAPKYQHHSFEDRFNLGLRLATSTTEARESEASYTSSSNNSEVMTDEDSPPDAHSRPVQATEKQAVGDEVVLSTPPSTLGPFNAAVESTMPEVEHGASQSGEVVVATSPRSPSHSSYSTSRISSPLAINIPLPPSPPSSFSACSGSSTTTSPQPNPSPFPLYQQHGTLPPSERRSSRLSADLTLGDGPPQFVILTPPRHASGQAIAARHSRTRSVDSISSPFRRMSLGEKR